MDAEIPDYSYEGLFSDGWKEVQVEPGHVYTTLGALRYTADRVLMAPHVVKFLIETFEFPAETFVQVRPGKVSLFREDA
jgi:hypothetical protein